MGSIWGTSPFSAYAAQLAETHQIAYMAPQPLMATSNVAAVNIPNTSLQMSQSIQPPITQMTQVTQMTQAPALGSLGPVGYPQQVQQAYPQQVGYPQPVYMNRPGSPVLQY